MNPKTKIIMNENQISPVHTDLSRRQFMLNLTGLSVVGVLSGGATAIASVNSSSDYGGSYGTSNISSMPSVSSAGQFRLPKLPYSYDALEPYIDARTMKIHHSKHHNGYVSKVNKALQGIGYTAPRKIEDLVSNMQIVPPQIRTAVRNSGGGHANHSLFWNSLSPDGGGQPGGALAGAIKSRFGGFKKFQKAFANAAATRFGSGWAWLSVAEGDNSLFVSSTPNQDSPLMNGIVEFPGTPILGLDVWEHAYYLNYQNRRGDYIKNWWKIVNWKTVAMRYETALKG